MCYPGCGVGHMKDPSLLVGESLPCSGFPLSPSGPLPHVKCCITENVLSESLNKAFPSLLFSNYFIFIITVRNCKTPSGHVLIDTETRYFDDDGYCACPPQSFNLVFTPWVPANGMADCIPPPTTPPPTTLPPTTLPPTTLPPTTTTTTLPPTTLPPTTTTTTTEPLVGWSIV